MDTFDYDIDFLSNYMIEHIVLGSLNFKRIDINLNLKRAYAQNIHHAIFYALRQLAYTPSVYVNFYACADFKCTLQKFYNTLLSHSNQHSSSNLASFQIQVIKLCQLYLSLISCGILS